jgi:predicted small lipoprotein YifL
MVAMRISQTTVAGLVAATTLAVALAGCGSKTPSKSPSGSVTSATSATSSTSGPASSAPAQPNDYAGLLIQAADIKAPETFTASPPTNNPNGQPGIATTFSTPDSNHVIHDTIQVLADAAAATNALNAAKTGQGNAIKDPQSQPMKDIGTGGTLVSGNTPDGNKGVAVLLFTEGRAFVTLQFDGPPSMLPPPDFVSDVGQKQDAAVKKGLGG